MKRYPRLANQPRVRFRQGDVRTFAFGDKAYDAVIHAATDAVTTLSDEEMTSVVGQPIVIKGDGSPLRSYLYADDLVEWLFKILERGESGRPYNVGSDEAISIRDLAVLVRETLQSKSEIKVLGQTVAGAANCYVPNVSRARDELGLVQKVSLPEAILASSR